MAKIKLKKTGLLVIILTIIFLVVAFLGVITFYFMTPVSNNYNEKNIIIEQGSTVSDIAFILKQNHIIKNEKFFKLYLKIRNVSNIYAAGYYLSPDMSLSEVVDTLVDGGHNEAEITLTFREGLNMRGIINIITSNTNNKEEDIYKLLKDKDFLNTLINDYWFINEDILNSKIYYSLEGYLFPDTYRFSGVDVTTKEIFKVMLDKMEIVLSTNKDKITNSNYSVHELLTLASITQSEGVNEDDFKNIASVFYNRLSSNMSLGSCVTSYYGVKKEMTEELMYKDINSNNSYNTRGNNPVAMPVGPISNPGENAIDAVINPITTSYYYFVSDKNHKLYFTKTNNEHEQVIEKLQNEGMWYEW